VLCDLEEKSQAETRSDVVGMAHKDDSFHEFMVHDVLGGIPGITSRAMFSGWGIYKNGTIFAIIAEGELYFKVDATTQGEYETRGSHPFVYSVKDRGEVMLSYWALPEEVMENQEELAIWVDTAVGVSKRSKKKVKKSK